MDAGTDADSGIPLDSGTSLIVTDITAYYDRKGIELRPRDFAASPVELLSDDGGTPVTIQGTVEQPGRMRFDVPPGTYVLKSSASRYVVTSERLVELGYRTFGRPEAADNRIPLTSTFFDLDISGLQPISVSGTPGQNYLSFSSQDLPMDGNFSGLEFSEGQTSVRQSGVQMSPFPYSSIPRFDTIQGDTAWVIQNAGQDAGMPPDPSEDWTSASSIVAAAQLAPFSFDGGTLPIKAHLSPVTQNGVHVEWHLEEFDALRSASAPDAATSSNISFQPMLRHARDGWIAYAESFLFSFTAQGTTGEAQRVMIRDFSYGNPYPTDWEPMAYFSQSYDVPLSKWDGSETAYDSEWLDLHLPLSSLVSQPAVRPVLSFPRDLKVEDMPAFPSRRLMTTTPRVTWEPPALGTPSQYILGIELLRHSGRLAYLSRIARIELDAEHRSVLIPPGLLSPGNTYALSLTAESGAGVAGRMAPLLFTLPYAESRTLSGLLTVQ